MKKLTNLSPEEKERLAEFYDFLMVENTPCGNCESQRPIDDNFMVLACEGCGDEEYNHLEAVDEGP